MRGWAHTGHELDGGVARRGGRVPVVPGGLALGGRRADTGCDGRLQLLHFLVDLLNRLEANGGK
eukprot:98996-Pyramimonas_sp.AAC.1